MAIHESTTVKVIEGLYAGKTGKVVHAYPSLGVAVVCFDDNGDVAKISLSSLVEIRLQENRETKSEIPEGAKEISRADFDAALIQATTVAMSQKIGDPSVGIMGAMTGAIVGEFIGSEIFKESDVVAMTEDQLITILWEGCSPERVSETVDKEMSLAKSASVSIAAFMVMKKIPRILFGAENG